MIRRSLIFVVAFGLCAMCKSAFADNKERCGSAVVSAVGKYYKIKSFSFSSDESEGVIVAGVCKKLPANKTKTIAAFAYDAGVEFEKQLVVALIDNVRGAVVASYKGVILEDAATEVNSYSLRLDTAPYILSSETRAFGIRVNTFHDRCGYEGGLDNALTLFVVDGKEIRPVLEQIMSYWSYAAGNRCVGEDVERSDVDLFISVEPTVSNGFADLLITAKRADGGSSIMEKVIYDGKRYRLESWEKKFNKWWY